MVPFLAYPVCLFIILFYSSLLPYSLNNNVCYNCNNFTYILYIFNTRRCKKVERDFAEFHWSSLFWDSYHKQYRVYVIL